MKVLVKQELTNRDFQKELFEKNGIITLAHNTDNLELFVPTSWVSGETLTHVSMSGRAFSEIKYSKDDNKIQVDRHNHSCSTPHDFEFELNKITTWIGQTILPVYKDLSIGKLYSLYVMYTINRALFDNTRTQDEGLIELAHKIVHASNSISVEKDINQNADTAELEKEVEQHFDKIADCICYTLREDRILTGKGNTFVNFFSRLFQSDFFENYSEYTYLCKKQEMIKDMIKFDLMFRPKAETTQEIIDTYADTIRNTSFNQFEFGYVKLCLAEYIHSTHYIMEYNL